MPCICYLIIIANVILWLLLFYALINIKQKDACYMTLIRELEMPDTIDKVCPLLLNDGLIPI